MDKNFGLYRCNICNKEYKSYKSLWNHTKIKHIVKVIHSKPMVNIKKYLCKHFNKELSCKQSKCTYEKSCNKSEINLLKEKINELEKIMKITINKSSNKIINKTFNNNITIYINN